MPRSAPTPCRYPGCAEVVAVPGYCDGHRPLIHRDYGRARRGFDAEVGFYQSKDWQVLRAAVLRESPLCVVCKAKERLIAAGVVDHVVPLKDGGARFDRDNLQPLCVSCHNRKTARETAGRRQTPEGGRISTVGRRRCARLPKFFRVQIETGGDPPG